MAADEKNVDDVPDTGLPDAAHGSADSDDTVLGQGDSQPNRRRFLGWLGGAAVVGAGVAAWELTRPDVPARVASAAPTTTTTVRPHSMRITVVTEPSLPIPQALPDPDAPEPDIVLGRIAIPRLELEANLQEGIALTSINRGPGHWPGTAMPGQLGNVVVAGHRVTHTEPFRHLERLVAGDPVVFLIGSTTWTYLTRAVVVVSANAVDIAAQSQAHTATLFACHPPGESTERIVAKLRLVDARGNGVDAAADLPPVTAGSQAGGHVLTVELPDPLSSSGS